MKVHVIKEVFQRYQAFLTAQRDNPRAYFYDIIDQFQNFDLNDASVSQSFDNALQSNISRRLWRRENFDAKLMMLQFMKMEPDYVRQMFKDLFDESRAVDARIDRFRFYCDELFEIYRQQNPGSIQTQHDQDITMISLYLTGRFPEQYAIYPGYNSFQFALKTFGSPEPLLIDDLPRYFKVVRVLDTLMRKEDGLLKIISTQHHGDPQRMAYRQWVTDMLNWMSSE